MKTILCYGDSNTWGADPGQGPRYARDVRWPGVLRSALGGGFEVIEEGLSGRTTVLEDPFEPGRSGKAYLYPCLMTHRPLDLVILMLGTNDTKQRFGVPASDIAKGISVLIELIHATPAGIDDQPARVLLMAPPPIAPLAPTRFVEMFEGAEAKSARFAQLYHAVALEHGCAFFDAGSVIASSPRDAIHFEPDAHRVLGEAVAAKVRELLGA